MSPTDRQTPMMKKAAMRNGWLRPYWLMLLMLSALATPSDAWQKHGFVENKNDEENEPNVQAYSRDTNRDTEADRRVVVYAGALTNSDREGRRKAVRLMGEKARRKNIKIFNCFVDFTKAFDSVDQSITWAGIELYGVDKKLTRLLREINGNATVTARIGNELGE